jgi:prepilin-type N-terminal cleavage/methylation domain-containing protein
MKISALSIGNPRSRAGFSLVEMIGVLAIIAILAVVIVPKVFSTIASSRITNAVGSVNSIKTAVSEFAGKHGTIPLANNTLRVDDLLVRAGMLESRFSVKVGNAASGSQGGTWALVNGTWTSTAGGTNQAAAPVQSRIISVNSNAVSPATANGANFCLNPSTPINLATDSLPAGSRVVAAVIAGVTAAEALELSRRIDGDNLSEPDATTADARGKCVYPAGAGVKNVYIYVAHQ